MKITQTNETTASVVGAYRTTENVKKETKTDGQLPKSETIELSSDVKDYGQMKNVIDSMPDVREDKVQQLKQQISDGTYSVSGESIAAKMVSESLLDIIA